jgi:hypothetical protein
MPSRCVHARGQRVPRFRHVDVKKAPLPGRPVGLGHLRLFPNGLLAGRRSSFLVVFIIRYRSGNKYSVLQVSDGPF